MRTLILLTLPVLIPPACVVASDPDPLELFRQWAASESPQLRMQAIRSLSGQSGPESRAALLSLLGDPHPGVRGAVREALLNRPSDEGPELARAIADLKSADARFEGLRALLARRDDPLLFVEDDDARVRARALASGRIPPAAARTALKDPDPVVRAWALEAVHDADLAHAMADDRDAPVRIAAARSASDPALVCTLLADRSWRVRLAALRAAERLRDASTIPVLIGRLGREEGRLHAHVAGLLERLTGAPFGSDQAKWRQWWARNGAGFVPRPAAAPRGAGHGSDSAANSEGAGAARPARSEDRTVARVTFRHIPIDSLRLCFVLDASRSMEKPSPGGGGDGSASRWELVKRDLFGVLDRLPPQARFNVILFRTGVDVWQPRLMRASSGARARCRAWVDAVEPSGWTNLFDALATALADDDVDALYVLTDGVPSRGAETRRRAILDEIEWLNHYRLVQINTVQAGGSEGLSKSWDGFLAELAASHGGSSVRE